MNTLLANAGFLREIFDAIPAMLMIVDEDVRIVHINTTAAKDLGLDGKDVFQKRGGEVLHCIHATDVPEGCGRGPLCKSCLIRNAVGNALRGEKTYRKDVRFERLHEGGKTEMHLLITASPLKYEQATYVLLTLENISELIRLKGLLPICMHCKRIKNDEGYWNDIADYLNTHLDVDFTHGLCSECLEKYYPEYPRNNGQNTIAKDASGKVSSQDE